MIKRRKPDRHRFARRAAWAANARSLGLRWRLHLQLVGGASILIAVLALWPHMLLRQCLIGACVGAVAAALAISIARFDDPQVRGDLAEQFSAEAFAKVRGWRVINGLSFGDGDLDHLVITPSRLLAVETKYRFRQADRRRLAAQRRADLDAATRAARKATSLLRSKQVAQAAAVTPVLMVWGKGAPDLDGGFAKVGDVYVLDGDRPGLWTHLFNAPLLSPTSRDAIRTGLAAFQRSQSAWIERKEGTLRAMCWREFRAGLRDSSAQRRNDRSRQRALRRRHLRRAQDAVRIPRATADGLDRADPNRRPA